jgi:hypothetical protein
VWIDGAHDPVPLHFLKGCNLILTDRDGGYVGIFKQRIARFNDVRNWEIPFVGAKVAVVDGDKLIVLCEDRI